MRPPFPVGKGDRGIGLTLKIKIKLFGPLKHHLPAGTKGRVAEIVLSDHATIDDLAIYLGIEEEPAVVSLNDQESHRGRKLQEGDVVAFFPPLAGG